MQVYNSLALNTFMMCYYNHCLYPKFVLIPNIHVNSVPVKH